MVHIHRVVVRVKRSESLHPFMKGDSVEPESLYPLAKGGL